MKKKNPFLLLPREDQATTIRPFIEQGGSYGSVAVRFGVKRGRIAGICRDYGILTTRSAGFEELAKSSSGRVLKLAPPGSSQCIARDDKGYQCAFLKEHDSDYCGLPAHRALAKRRAR